MRVIAGKYRHRILKWPDDASHIRPTKDRIRSLASRVSLLISRLRPVSARR